MRLQELKEGLDKSVRDMIERMGKEIAGTEYFADIKPGMRMWTRGDGSKYKEPSLIKSYFSDSEVRDRKSKTMANFPKEIKDATDVVNAIWAKIIAMPGAKNIGDISGEFGSSESMPAVLVGNTIFIKQDFSIRYATKSILRNKGVWRQKGVEEGMYDPSGELSLSAYNKVLNDLETKGVNNKKATAAKNMVISMWQKGDKLVGNYKSIIKDFGIDI